MGQSSVTDKLTSPYTFLARQTNAQPATRLLQGATLRTWCRTSAQVPPMLVCGSQDAPRPAVGGDRTPPGAPSLGEQSPDPPSLSRGSSIVQGPLRDRIGGIVDKRVGGRVESAWANIGKCFRRCVQRHCRRFDGRDSLTMSPNHEAKAKEKYL